MLRAIIFDFDGVIADTEPLHYAAFERVLDGRGVMPSREAYFETYVGLNDAAFLRAVFEKSGRTLSEDELRALLDRKDAAYMESIAGGLPLLPGVEAFVRRAGALYSLAICSGARRLEIETILRGAGLLDAFPIIVSADDVALSKPDPEGFLRALELLAERTATQPEARAREGGNAALRPEECLVIEDSANGVIAAKAAGMRVVRVRSHAGPCRAAADLEVSDLTELTAERMARLL